MTAFESNSNNAVEVDGISFETLMPESLIRIPPKQDDAKTQIQFVIRITNNTAITSRLLLFFFAQNL